MQENIQKKTLIKYHYTKRVLKALAGALTANLSGLKRVLVKNHAEFLCRKKRDKFIKRIFKIYGTKDERAKIKRIEKQKIRKKIFIEKYYKAKHKRMKAKIGNKIKREYLYVNLFRRAREALKDRVGLINVPKEKYHYKPELVIEHKTLNYLTPGITSSKETEKPLVTDIDKRIITQRLARTTIGKWSNAILRKRIRNLRISVIPVVRGTIPFRETIEPETRRIVKEVRAENIERAGVANARPEYIFGFEYNGAKKKPSFYNPRLRKTVHFANFRRNRLKRLVRKLSFFFKRKRIARLLLKGLKRTEGRRGYKNSFRKIFKWTPKPVRRVKVYANKSLNNFFLTAILPKRNHLVYKGSAGTVGRRGSDRTNWFTLEDLGKQLKKKLIRSHIHVLEVVLSARPSRAYRFLMRGIRTRALYVSRVRSTYQRAHNGLRKRKRRRK